MFSRSKPTWILSVFAVLSLGGCASFAPTEPPGQAVAADDTATARPPQVTARANSVVFHAMSLIGTPYRWGGESPQTGFDCSGLVQYVYRAAVGIRLPRTSAAMSRVPAPKIQSIAHLATGDVLFFDTGWSGISHVAIYVGDGQFVDAPSSGEQVQLESLHNPYWRSRFVFARRVLAQ